MADFNKAKEEILVNLFIQLGIYVLFLILVFIFAFWLAKLVVKNVVSPIDKLVDYLDKEKVDIDQHGNLIKKNKEFNEISALFKKLFVLFRFAKPDFFDAALQEKLLDNYETARELFSEIKNDRGKAICDNNMGNILHEMKMYEEAIEKFQMALKSTKKLRETVNKEFEEGQKSDSKEGLSTDDLEKELTAIDDLIHHRIM